MTQVYFIKNDHEWSSDELPEMLLPLPEDIRNKISAYKGWRERQSRVLSKLLLLRLLEKFELDLTLTDLKYTEFNKPYFEPLHNSPLRRRRAGGEVNFSSAHSGEMVICVGTMNAEIGVDIEQIIPIELTDYEEHLTKNEWEYIQKASDILSAFYQLWTKKEALLKALGRGIDIAFNTLDVSGDMVSYDDKSYWFYPLTVEGYVAHVATSVPFDSGSISSEKLSDPL